MRRSTDINTVIETASARAATIGAGTPRTDSTLRITGALTVAIRSTWASMTTSSKAIAAGIRRAMTTATPVGQFALTLTGSIRATIQIGSLAATRVPIPTGIGATRMLPLTRVIEMDSRPDRTTCGSARTMVRISTTPTRMPTTVIEGTTATRINSRNNIGRDLFVVTRMLSTGWNVKIDEQPA